MVRARIFDRLRAKNPFMKSVQEILPSFYRRGVGGDQVDQELVCSCWASVVGPQIACRTRPVRIFRKKLLVEVSDQDWCEPLAELNQRITRRLNKAVGASVVEGIQFRQAMPAKKPVGRAISAAASDECPDEASRIEDSYLRRIYRASQKKREIRPSKREDSA